MAQSLPSGNAAATDKRRLLFDLMRSPETVDRALLERLSPEDWDALIVLANRQRCAPYLSYVLAQIHGIEQPAKLTRIRDRYTLKAMQIGRECAIMSATLAEEGIRHVFMKGVVLALRDYPEPWMRPMRDIDLLVDPSQLEEAHALLLAQGGAMQEYAYRPVERTELGKHLPPIHSPNRVLPVEVHYRMLVPEIALPETARTAIEQSAFASQSALVIGDVTVPVPDTETMLAHLIVHGLYDHELNNGPQFVTDMIHLLRGNALDRTKWADLVQRTGLAGAVELAASLLPPPERALLIGQRQPRAALPDEAVLALMFQDVDRRSELKLFASLAEDTNPNRVGTIFGKLFASRTTLTGRWVADGGTLGEEPRSMPLFWAWSLWRTIRRFLGGRRPSKGAELQGLRDLRTLLGGHRDDR